MTSYTQRYAGGEHRAVWTELGALAVVPAELVDDVADVARETMRRVCAHVVRIAEALDRLGFVPASSRIPVHEPPTDAELADIDVLDAEIGGLPAAFAACLREVGGVSFLGDCPALRLAYNGHVRVSGVPPGPEYPDPLFVAPANYLRYSWDERREEDPEDLDDFTFEFAPDELHKTNISGGTHDLALPDPCPNPRLYRVAGRPQVRLVEYLRISIEWGGFPGWSFAPEQAPAALAGLRAEPDF